MNTFTTDDVINLFNLIQARAQWCRENGESDMRNILYIISAIKDRLRAGISTPEILDYFTEVEEED